MPVRTLPVELEIGQQFDSIVILEETIKKYCVQNRHVFVKGYKTLKLRRGKKQDESHFAVLQRKFAYKGIDFSCKFGEKRKSESKGVRNVRYIFSFKITIIG